METTIAEAPVNEEAEPSTFRLLLSLRDFRLLWLGETISLLGDQFHLIALPWLALQLTGDGFVMGTVLALGGIPRALFMLLGGAITDRFSPRSVMLGSNIARMLIVGILTLVVLSNHAEVWMLYVFSLAFGLADAFFFPAQQAIVPQLVPQKALQTVNAIVQGTAQLSLFAGPVLAGILIATFGGNQIIDGGEAVPNLEGIGLAFGLDALTFLVSAFSLWLIRNHKEKVSNEETSQSIWESLKEGLSTVWNDHVVRGYFIIIATSNFLINGPIWVGIPYLADTRYAEGAAAYGIIISAFGGGSLLGTILAGILPRLRNEGLGLLLGVIWSGLGLAVIGFGLANSTLLATIIAGAMGIANGYVTILFITWLQSRSSEHMLGRVMSMMIFASLGLSPIAFALTGALIEINTVGLFIISGSLMTFLVLISMLNPALRTMGEHQPNH